MSWNNFIYGDDSCGCSDGNCGNNNYDPNRERCDGRDLLRGVSKNECIKVFLKNSGVIKGHFAGISGNIVTLFNCDKNRVSSTSICVEDIVAVRTFSFNDCGCSKETC